MFKRLTYWFYYCFLILVSCKQPEKLPPVVFNSDITAFEFSVFEESSSGGSNFLVAAEQVLLWKSLLNDSISLHKAILKNAENSTLIFQKENTWLSEFVSVSDGVNFLTKFFCIETEDSVLYKAYITFETDTNKLVIEGRANKTNSSGLFFFFKPGFENDEYTYIKFLNVFWSIDSLNNKTIKFTNNQIGENNLNSFLIKDTTSVDYNSYLEVYDKGNERICYINRNKVTKKGRVKYFFHYNNDDWHCWNEQLSDINCN